MIVHLPPLVAADIEIGSVLKTVSGWARVTRRHNATFELQLLPWWSLARAWRTVATRVGLGGWT